MTVTFFRSDIVVGADILITNAKRSSLIARGNFELTHTKYNLVSVGALGVNVNTRTYVCAL